jgi:hypothetical protein
MENLTRAARIGSGLLLAAALAGCASVNGQTCPAGLEAMTSADLYFGLSIPGGGTVSEADWQRFVDEEITPRFPDGLTITDAKGQWKSASGLVREPSKHLFVIKASADAEKIAAIRAAYRARFHQESVLLVETPVCGSF